ncbi:MAG TPA: type II secretion system protein GspL [Steroidobacteraceae bacterium]|nr:type II secretion system protein GspL [Steroidobacteraceae bacterium]
MTETLVIRLRSTEDAPASWFIIDGNGARSGSVLNGPISDALVLAQGRRTVVILPAAEVTLAEPDLPPVRGAARIAQAVPFALEEQLASDLENLHFAVGPRNPAASATPVAIVSRSVLDRWQATWDAAGIHPDAAYAESSLMPAAPNATVLVLDEGTLHVKRPGAVAYALDALSLATALELTLAPSSSEAGEHVTFYVGTADYESNRELVEGLRERTATLQVKLLPDGILPLLAAQLPTARAVNLLQGAYAPPSSFGSQLRQWRLPAALAAATLLVFFGAQGLKLWQLHQAEKRLNAEIAQTFESILPGQPMVDPRAQVQGVLARAGGGAGALLPAVSLLAQAVAKSPATRIEGMNYRGGVLELRVVAPTIETLDGIRQTLSSRGATVELQSTNPRDQQVEGRLHVRLGAA